LVNSPEEMDKYMVEMFKTACELLRYDPGYDYEAGADGSEEEGWGSDYEEAEEDKYDEDDSSSWKVRRAAIRVIHSIVKTRLDFQGEVFSKYGALLIGQFKERTDDVKIEILNTVQSLLESTVQDTHADISLDLKNQKSVSMTK
jgi:cullin-associated NEDD8-dissociated protein 1